MVEIYSPAGVDVGKAHSTAQFKPGSIARGENGSEYVYVQDSGSGVTGAGYAVVIDEDFVATMTAAALLLGDLIGISPIAVTADYYFWAQRKGTASIRVAASAAANVILNATSTAGQLDDNNEASTEEIAGLVLTTANGGAAGTAEGVLNYPTVSIAAA